MSHRRSQWMKREKVNVIEYYLYIVIKTGIFIGLSKLLVIQSLGFPSLDF